MFSSYEKNQDPQRAITFGDGNKGLVKGLGKIAISPDYSISNVFLVDSLDYNLLLREYNCSIPKIQILKFSQTRSKFKMNFKFHFKMFVCELISTNKL
jgi:hypothetical protein